MPSPAYTFFLNKLHVNSKTSPGDYVDKDVVVFAVIWNGQVFAAPASNPAVGAPGGSQPAGVSAPFYVDGYIGLVESDNDILLCSLPNSQPAQDPVEPPGTNMFTSWVVGPLSISDEDIVTVFYSVTNLSYFKGNPTPTYLAVVAAQLGYIAGVVELGGGGPADPVTDIIAGVAAILGALIGGLAAIWNDIFPGQPNCNGAVVVSPALSFTGSQLEQQVSTPIPATNITQFTTTIVNAGLSAVAASNCSTPSTDVTWSILRDISSLDIFGPTPPPPKMSTRSLVVSKSPQDWSGMWGDGQYMNNSRITCVIDYSGAGVAGASYGERISSYTSGLIHSINQDTSAATLLGRDPRARRAAALSIPATPMMIHAISLGPAVAAPVSARYSADIIEHLGSSSGQVAVNISARNLVEIPMVALSVPQNDIYPSASLSKAVPFPALEGALASAAPAAIPRSASTFVNFPGLPQTMTPAVPLVFVATLVASADVSLQLYGLFDPNGTIVAHKIRYLRTSDAGDVVTDVMLSPVAYLPT